jgi:hypothetical protein
MSLRNITDNAGDGIFFPNGQIETLFGHTHPRKTGLSEADFKALVQLNQSRQYVFERFNPDPILIRKRLK